MRISAPERLVKGSAARIAVAQRRPQLESCAAQRIEQAMTGHLRLVAGIIALMSLLPLAALSQSSPPGLAAPATASAAPLPDEQLDQLTAPIALYSDPLVGQILMAATYPLEVVEAQRWLQDPANAALKGDVLTAALQQQSWDLSVKSLVPFPQILQMMDTNLEWTERIGDAFLAQQGAVMDSIQRLRHRAAAAGSLTSTPQQTVSIEDQDIEIEPPGPDMVYVPYYDPTMVYGPWPWSDTPPFYLLPPPGVVVLGGLAIGFGFGFPILGPFWGWHHWDWPHHRLDLDGGRVPVRAGYWEHDPSHRRGVPYRNASVAARYRGESAAAPRDVRGFPGAAGAATGAAASERGAGITPRETPTRVAPANVRTAPSAFESFAEGARVRDQAARGAASRGAPAPRPGPSARGGGAHHR